MGTWGAKVFRHHGRSFVYPYSSDGVPEGRCLEAYNLIPKNRDTFERWIQVMRTALDEAFEQYDSDQYKDAIIDDRLDIFDSWDGEYGMAGHLEYVYEINLDAGVFCYQGYPAFHLANMPPQNVFLRICRGREDKGRGEGEEDYYEPEDDTPYCDVKDSNARRWGLRPLDVVALHHLTPKEYQFDIAGVWASAVKDEDLLLYNSLCVGVVPMTEMQDLLGLRSRLSDAEDICLYLLRDCTVLISQCRLKALYHNIALADTWTSIYSKQTAQGVHIALFLACMALLPFTALCGSLRTSSLDQTYLGTLLQGAKGHYWFPRRHICYTTGTHLLNDRSARYHVSRVVNHILSRPTSDIPSIVYGVVFSVFHCIVIRVNVVAGGSFQRTEVLDFLPPSFKDSDPWGIIPPTPGMILMTRLGHLAAQDDLQFFYNNLSTRWWNMIIPVGMSTNEQDQGKSAERSKLTTELQPSRSRTSVTLPLDIFSLIAYSIDDPRTLLNFTLASKATMTASIPRLRHPQFIPLFHTAYFLSSNGGIIVGRLHGSEPDLFPTAFNFVHDRGLDFLQIMESCQHRASTRNFPWVKAREKSSFPRLYPRERYGKIWEKVREKVRVRRVFPYLFPGISPVTFPWVNAGVSSRLHSRPICSQLPALALV